MCIIHYVFTSESKIVLSACGITYISSVPEPKKQGPGYSFFLMYLFLTVVLY